jgi:hypothetical protein
MHKFTLSTGQEIISALAKWLKAISGGSFGIIPQKCYYVRLSELIYKQKV